MFINAADFWAGGVEKPQPLLVQAAGEDHFIHRGREVPLGPGLLGQIAHGSLPQFRRPRDLPGLGREEPQQAPQQRGLAGAVVPHDAQVVPRPDGEIQVGQDALTLIPQGRVPADDQLIGAPWWSSSPAQTSHTPENSVPRGSMRKWCSRSRWSYRFCRRVQSTWRMRPQRSHLSKKAIPVALGLAAAVLVQGALLGVDLVDPPRRPPAFPAGGRWWPGPPGSPPDAGPPPVRRRCRRSSPPGLQAAEHRLVLFGAVWHPMPPLI